VSHHSLTSSRVRDIRIHYLLTTPDIDTTSAYSFGFISAQDFMDYGTNNTQELFHMFHKTDLENDQLVAFLLRIKAVVHTLDHMLEQGHNSIPKTILKQA
jgi:hypothetical protein